MALVKLGCLVGDTRYLESAQNTILLFGDEIRRHASVNGSMTMALQHMENRHTTVVIRGSQEECDDWLQHCNRIYRPLTSVYAIANNQASLPAELALRKPEQTTVAYLCRGKHCSAPIRSLEELEKMLSTPATSVVN
jgi:uncharacterized protein YyaL (SSP411 family)